MKNIENAPSQEEMAKAEEMMTPEQKVASDTREKFMFQERDPFDDFMVNVDEQGEVRPATPEEKELMDNNLVKLGEIFKDSGVRWHLDGALNISLMKGEYIRPHKDIDISVEPDDLEKFDSHLAKQGYGLFSFYFADPEEGKSRYMMRNILKRMSSKACREAKEEEHLMIAAIDEQGEILEGEKPNFIDLHIIQRNKEGLPIGWRETVLPNEWFEPQPIDFQGQTINLSHPAKVALFKIGMGRSYDHTDLRHLAETGKISTEDADGLERVLKQEYGSRRQKSKDLTKRVFDKIESDMSGKQIFDIFVKEPLIAERIEVMEVHFRELSEEIAKSNDKSFENVLRMFFEKFDLENAINEVFQRVEQLRQWVSDAEEAKKARQKIKDS